MVFESPGSGRMAKTLEFRPPALSVPFTRTFMSPALPLFAQLRRYTLAVITAAEVAALTGGEVEGAAELLLSGAEVDSRRLQAGDLFVALPGARRDGHDFVCAA